MNLFEINSAIAEIKAKDLDPEVLADTLESLELARDVKLDGIANWIENNKSDINWITDKISQLSKEKKRLTNQNDRLMAFLTSQIDATGYKQLKTENHILAPRNYKDKTIIDAEYDIPAAYREITFEAKVHIDKNAIYRALKAGENVTGARLEPNRKTIIK